MSRWISYDFSDVASRYSVKNLPGVYVVYGDKGLIYVGQSTDVKKRMACHSINYANYTDFIETPWGRFRSVFVKIKYTRRYGDWAMLELRLIKRLQPPFNCIGSTKRRGVNNGLV